ncbi:L-threonine 3-dehydrogenase, partial [candidate division TA06 bacterium]
MDKILITGSLGQIGSELALELRKRYGNDNVVVSDIRRVEGSRAMETGPFELLDCTDSNSIANIVKKYKIDTIY